VTGDGTNDAPALKAADVGLAMGITGTKVAQGAADIVILDDKFSSIIKAMIWGRAVFDNIRKFLQFQLTVNISALSIVFISAITGSGDPITAVQMLWVNLIMDTMGALALATESPSSAVLSRKPYKRKASLISRPMWRNIICQSMFQVSMLLVLMFRGSNMFNVNNIGTCLKYIPKSIQERNLVWDPVSTTASYNGNSELSVSCSSFEQYCGNESSFECFQNMHIISNNDNTAEFTFSSLEHYDRSCLLCVKEDYTLSTIIFNFFIFCQLFNEISSRRLGNEINFLQGIRKNRMFIAIIIFSIIVQILIVEIGGQFMKTSPLTLLQWVSTIAMAAGTIVVGILMRYFIPVREDPKSFFTGNNIIKGSTIRSGWTVQTPGSSKTNGTSSKKHKKSISKSNIKEEGKDQTEDLTAKLLKNL
jgi:magnesium-transporting ATPase (P-type)